ncbi:probable receptor-like protein kinase At2g23200 [Rutidosis leptorrhynchoides]|uniref:probable receptor-like protein kinase At2g23200 n=1 Tax=Rutidosis leptorrhynchoides TaxID=125765 RepID=UPI003A99C96B
MYLSNPKVTWVQRLKICIGIARALSYIHYEDGRSYSIIHCNINRSTILLDKNFVPKLSGFEYALNQSVHRMDLQVLIKEAIGTTGYMDPSIEMTGGVTHKSDIYSFGVVLWEVLYRRKALIPDVFDRFLAPLARFHHEKGTLGIQPDIDDQTGRQSARTFRAIAYSCSNDEREQRPDMKLLLLI